MGGGLTLEQCAAARRTPAFKVIVLRDYLELSGQSIHKMNHSYHLLTIQHAGDTPDSLTTNLHGGVDFFTIIYEYQNEIPGSAL